MSSRGRSVYAARLGGVLEPTGAHWGTHPLSAEYLREARRLFRALFLIIPVDGPFEPKAPPTKKTIM